MSQPLIDDLDDLVNKEIITPATADNIRAYYESKKDHSSTRFTSILSVLGAILLCTGVILVIAHNWDMFGKTTRTIFAFLPLIIGQVLCAYSFIKKKNNKVWLECSSVILFFGVASCISLIAQIYQVSGTLTGFLLAWMLVTLPLVYIMPSAIVSLLLIAVATWHGTLTGYGGYLSHGIPYQYLIIIILLLPNYLNYYKKDTRSNVFHLHNWFLAISFSIMLGGFANSSTDAAIVFCAYISLAGLYYLAGYSELMKKQRWFCNPFLLLGTVCIIFSFLLWSFNWLWEDGNRDNYSISFLLKDPLNYITLLILLFSVYLMSKRIKNDINPTVFSGVDIAGFSPFAFIIGISFFHHRYSGGIVFFNLWVLMLGLSFVRRGAARDHLGVMNFGLLVIAALAIMRFFDDSIPFIWRGLFFIGTGIAFFVANSVLLKKRRLSKTNPL